MHNAYFLSTQLLPGVGDRGIMIDTVSPRPTETEMVADSGDDPESTAAHSPIISAKERVAVAMDAQPLHNKKGGYILPSLCEECQAPESYYQR